MDTFTKDGLNELLEQRRAGKSLVSFLLVIAWRGALLNHCCSIRRAAHDGASVEKFARVL